MMAIRATAVAFVMCLATGAQAQERAERLTIGDDAFLAGGTVVFSEDGVDDLFAAGQSVAAEAGIAGNAYLAGRRVTVSGPVGGDAHAAGFEIAFEAPVAGDATAAGYEVRVGEIGGDLRVSGAELSVTGPVAGYAMIAGDEVTFDAEVGGDVSLAARVLDIGDAARVGGILTLYEEEPGSLEVPDSLVPADRIVRRQIEDWEGRGPDFQPVSLSAAVARFFAGVLFVAAIAAVSAWLLPAQLAAMRERILAAPLRTLGYGFVVQSAVIGSSILFALTIIGILLTPAAIFLSVVGALAGYVIGVYAFGVGLMSAAGQSLPDSPADRALAAGVGALVAGLLALVPFLGWLFVLALALSGVGALTLRFVRPGMHMPES